VPIYQAWNGPSPTTGALLHVTTGTAVKTMLQLEDATYDYTILAWGISFDGAAVGAGIQVSLLEQDVAATVTAHVAAGLIKWDDPNAVASSATLGTANTGYTSSAENAPTVSRVFDSQKIDPAAGYVYEFSLGQRPKLLHGRFLKVRIDVAAAAVNAICFVRWSTD
jgi:hypothetical protein